MFSWPMSRDWRTISSRSWSAPATTTIGRSRSVIQPSQLANTGRSALEIEPGTCPAENSAIGRASTIRAAGGDVPVDGVDVEPVESRERRVVAWAAPVELGEPGEVGGEGAEPGQQLLDEGVLVVDAEQGVGRSFPSERGRAVGAAGCGAERTGAVGRVDGEVVGEAVEAAQRVEHLVGQRLGQIGSAQVGAPDGADHQRTAGEQRHR